MAEHLKPLKIEWTFDGTTIEGKEEKQSIVFEIPADLSQHITLGKMISLLVPPSLVVENIAKGVWTMEQLWDELRAHYASNSE